MKQFTRIFGIFMILMLCFSITDIDAQSRKKKKKKKKENDEYFDDKGSLTQRLWYGADLNFNFIPFQVGNIIAYGVSPMVGYKFNDVFSVGPRIQFSVLNGRISQQYRVNDLAYKYNATTYGLGAFARAKIFNSYFLHLEYDRVSYGYPVVDGNFFPQYDIDGNIQKYRISDNHLYIGVGYYGAIGGNWGYQAMALFDLAESRDNWEFNLPISFRFGINYKFAY